MEVVESRKCRCKFDSKERVLFQVATLDACGFSTYAYTQVNQSETTGARELQAGKKSAGHVDSS
jgi:hypothetical protein